MDFRARTTCCHISLTLMNNMIRFQCDLLHWIEISRELRTKTIGCHERIPNRQGNTTFTMISLQRSNYALRTLLCAPWSLSLSLSNLLTVHTFSYSFSTRSFVYAAGESRVYNLLVTSRHNKPLNHDIICFVSYLITKLLQSRTSSGENIGCIDGCCLQCSKSVPTTHTKTTESADTESAMCLLPQQSHHRIQTQTQQKGTISRQSDDTIGLLMNGGEKYYTYFYVVLTMDSIVWLHASSTQHSNTRRTRSRLNSIEEEEEEE